MSKARLTGKKALLMARLPQQKRGDCVGKTKRGKGTKIMVLADANGLPLAIEIESAQKSEVNLIESLLYSAATPHIPDKLIYDKAADSDPLRKRLSERGIDLICPHRSNRVRVPTQDGRKLRRYRRRWIIERTIIPAPAAVRKSWAIASKLAIGQFF